MPSPRHAPVQSGSHLAGGGLRLGNWYDHRVAAYGYRGGSLFERRGFSIAAALVKHPQGDPLIDTGFGGNIGEQFATLPLMLRAVTFYSLWQPAADLLTVPGYDQNRFILFFLTHAHWGSLYRADNNRIGLDYSRYW